MTIASGSDESQAERLTHNAHAKDPPPARTQRCGCGRPATLHHDAAPWSVHLAEAAGLQESECRRPPQVCQCKETSHGHVRLLYPDYRRIDQFIEEEDLDP